MLYNFYFKKKMQSFKFDLLGICGPDKDNTDTFK